MKILDFFSKNRISLFLLGFIFLGGLIGMEDRPMPDNPLGLSVGFKDEHNPRYRPTMEDNHDIQITPGHAFFGIYDGHGGKEVADYLTAHLYNNLIADPNFNTNIQRAFTDSFAKTDSDLATAGHMGTGSTATTALIKGNKIYIANVGDARTVLYDRNGNVIFASKDHKPDSPDETQRITDAGGFVVGHRVSGILAVSRAFGDHIMKHLVISTPDITELDLTPNAGFLILACDGLWDVVNNERAGEIVNRAPSVQAAAAQLVDIALKMGSRDNISVLVVDLRNYRAGVEASPRSVRPRAESPIRAPRANPIFEKANRAYLIANDLESNWRNITRFGVKPAIILEELIIKTDELRTNNGLDRSTFRIAKDINSNWDMYKESGTPPSDLNILVDILSKFKDGLLPSIVPARTRSPERIASSFERLPGPQLTPEQQVESLKNRILTTALNETISERFMKELQDIRITASRDLKDKKIDPLSVYLGAFVSGGSIDEQIPILEMYRDMNTGATRAEIQDLINRLQNR
ncbi:protein phosphatase 2C domain-containing protein [Candidatus Babeliales bacterium]|nr:protein phosphatase 2C domain-containing protein [Candidatus Babeliales bacterium]MCF7899554.1 protein phosphatase 2C domain-containing protein [Candidatus Babeliales bacterium]